MLLKRFWKKLAEMLVTLLGVTFLTFCLSVLAPGDPAAMVLEAGDHIVSEELLAETRHEMGLDQPFLVQYGRWLGGVAHGDLGLSYSAKKPVAEKLMEGSTGTFFLAAVTVCFMLIISGRPCIGTGGRTISCASARSSACRCRTSGSDSFSSMSSA